MWRLSVYNWLDPVTQRSLRKMSRVSELFKPPQSFGAKFLVCTLIDVVGHGSAALFGLEASPSAFLGALMGIPYSLLIAYLWNLDYSKPK
jgi:hypothetical protein